jgi:multicomponent Na+:H+ antiporter subunit D
VRELLTAALLPLLLIGLAFALPAISLVVRNPRFFRIYAVTASLLALAMALDVAVGVYRTGVTYYLFGGFRPPLGIVYTIDKLGAVLGLLSIFILSMSTIYSTWMVRSRWEYLYYTALLALGAGSVGCLYTGDVFNFFVMLEVLSISAYVLVAFYRDNPRAVEASIRYSIVGMVATSFYLLSAFVIYGSFGTLNMADVALKARSPLAQVQYSGGVFGNVILSSALAIALSMWTFTFKAAIFPNHFWLPDANPEAPTPISALFVAVIDLIGAYGAIRYLYTIFGTGSVIEYLRSDIMLVLHVLGALSALVGALLLVVQTDVKKFIAYSTISHMGLAFMAFTLGTERGVAAAVVQLVSNSLSEALLFYSAGIAIVASGRAIEGLSTLRRYKLASVAFVVGLLNLFGVVPLFIGFWSKVLIFIAMVEVGYIASALVLVASTGISGIGYVKLIRYLMRPSGSVREDERLRDLRLPYVVISVVLLALVLLGALFIYLPEFRALLEAVGAEVLDYSKYIEAVLGSVFKR